MAPVTSVLPIMGQRQPNHFNPWMPQPPAFFQQPAMGYVTHHAPRAGSSMPQAGSSMAQAPHQVPAYHGSMSWPVTSLAPRGSSKSIYTSSRTDGNSLYGSYRSDRPPPPPRPAEAAKPTPEFERPKTPAKSSPNPVLSSSVGVISSSDMQPPPRAPSPTNSQGSKRSSRSSKSVRSGTSSARRAQGAMFKPPSQSGSAQGSQNSSREPTPRGSEPMAM